MEYCKAYISQNPSLNFYPQFKPTLSSRQKSIYHKFKGEKFHLPNITCNRK